MPTKKCLITGTSSGIGESLSRELKASQFEVTSMQRTASDFYADYASPKVIAEALSQYEQSYQYPPDLAILNAGEGKYGRFIEFSPSDIIEHIQVNLIAPLMVAQCLLKGWSRRQMKGHLIFIGSQAALLGGSQSNNALYTAAKGGIHAVVPSLAKEYGPDVRVNGIAPGDVYTPLAERALEHIGEQTNRSKEDVREEIGRSSILQKWVDVEDIGRAVMYLEEASSVTGTVLNISAGKTM